MSTEQNVASERLGVVVAELGAIVDALDETQLEKMASAILGARRVFFSGQGRSGLMNRAIAIRLMHIGVAVHVAGEPSTPSIAEGDLLLAVSSSAKTQATLDHIAVARRVGAKVALVSSVADDPKISDVFLRIPAKLTVPSVQHAGSLFEQSWLVIGDALAWQVQKTLNVKDAVLNQRHANLQ